MMSVVNVNHPSGASHKDGIFPTGHMLPFSLVTSLFFMWGVPNNLNDILIRQFMKSFALTRFEAGLVQSAFYLGYFLLAIPAALIMRRFSYKVGILLGLSLYSPGAFLFWPAAIEGKYLYFLGALFVIASGLSFLETASNPFIAQTRGPAQFRAATQLLAGIQSAGCDKRCADWHHLHLFRSGIDSGADQLR